MVSISSDITDLILQTTLTRNTYGLNNAIQRMTSGFKVNHAKDNAANYSIITDLSKRISSMLQVQQNAADGASLLGMAEGGLSEIEGLLERLRDLAMQASNETYGEQSLASLQTEADEIIKQIVQIKGSISFDGMNLYETPNNGVAAVTQSDTPVTTRSAVRARAAAPAAQAENEIAGAEAFAGGETRTITIDGVRYLVKNKLATANDLSYSKDASSGELTLIASNFEIRGQEDVAHNIIISGRNNIIYGGNLDDTIEELSAVACDHNYIYGGDGDDTLIMNGNESILSGEDGDDILYKQGTYGYVYGGNGDDTIEITEYYGSINGGAGNDTFNINANNLTINGNDGDDTFNIIGTKTGITIDGGSGTNTVTGNVGTNTTVNVVGANSGTISLVKDVDQTVNINGIDYTVNTTAATAELLYTVGVDGKITFRTMNSAQVNIIGDKNKKHNVVLDSTRLSFYGGDKGDNISANKSDCTIYCGKGNNTIYSYYSYVYCGEGNNDITASVYTCVYGGSGVNNVTLQGPRNYVESGTGTMNVTISRDSSENMIYGVTGNNAIVSDGGFDNFIYGFGSADNAEAVKLGASEQNKVIDIRGVSYTLTNNNSKTSAVFYKVNDVTQEISFCAYRAAVYGQQDVAHNVNLYGFAFYFYGGDLDDTITATGYPITVYGGKGNDTLIANRANTTLHGGDGDDIFILNAGAQVYGEAGNDTITINAITSANIDGGSGDDIYNINAQATKLSDSGGNNIYNVNADNINISGGPGADTFYLSGDNNTVLGAGGDDYFVIDGSDNFIDGGTGANYYIDNGSNTKISNVNKDPNAGGLAFTYLGEVKTFELNGKTYTVTNNLSGSNMLQYSLNPNTGVITLNGSDLTVDAESDEQAFLNIRGNNNVINGSDLLDRITVEQGSNNTINGNAGNDVLISNSENNSLNGGDGNDTITLNASTNLEVSGGAGNDTINVNSDNNTQIHAGAGNNRIVVNGENNSIEAEDGNNTITLNQDSNTVKAGNGDNRFVVVSDDNLISAGSGSNSIGIQGSGNTLNAKNAKGDININGSSNDVTITRGDNNVVIKGNDNNFESTLGIKNVTVNGDSNNITTGIGDDTIQIKGNSNVVESLDGNNSISIKGNDNNYQGGAGYDDVKINGDNNIAKGGASNDSFMVSDGKNNTVDGEDGERDTAIDNGVATTILNAVDITPRPFELKLKIDIGYGADSFLETKISFSLFDFSVDFSTREGALESLDKIDEMLSNVRSQIVNIGNTMNRIDSVMEAQSVKLENLLSTRSTLRDADIAEESSSFIRYQILQNASATLLGASRNLKAQNVLALLNAV